MQKKLVISESAIRRRIAELGRQISQDFPDGGLLAVGILKGAFIFLADLVRAIDVPLEVDFIRVASYGDRTCSSGTCTMTKDLETDPAGRHILLIEDIADTGRTLDFLTKELAGRGARSVHCCVLIDKAMRRERAVSINYAGFSVPSGFLVGYGLDHAEQYRHLPAVYELLPDQQKQP